jgi:hypothetical protein
MTHAVDVHTHIFAPGWPDFAARHGGDRWPRLEGDPATGGALFLGATFNRALTPRPLGAATRRRLTADSAREFLGLGAALEQGAGRG